MKYINYNKHKNKSLLSLSNNIEYISPFLQNRNNNNNKNNNIENISSYYDNIIPKEKLYNIIGYRKTTSSGPIYYNNNNLNKINTIKDIFKSNININSKTKKRRNYEKYESPIVDIIGRQTK